MDVSKIGVGLIGCGAIASYYHLPILAGHQRVRVVAVADPSVQALDRARRITPAALLYTDPERLLDRMDIDAIVVCAESAQHAELARRVAAHRKALYLEKPLATSAADASTAIAAVQAAGIQATIGFNYRFHPLHQDAHRILETGGVGEVRTVRAIFHEPARRKQMPAWKHQRGTGGGALLDLGSHSFDLLCWHVGAEIASVSGSLLSRVTEHDTARLHVAMVGGVNADVDCRLGHKAADVFEVQGAKQTLRIDRLRGSLSLARAPGIRTPRSARWRLRVLRKSEPSFALALHAWIDRLLGADVILPTLEDGLRSLQAVLAAEASAA